MNIPVSLPTNASSFKGAKWHKVQVLFEDLSDLFSLLEPFHLVNASEIKEEPLDDKREYLKKYQDYIDALKNKRPYVGRLSAFMTRSLNSLVKIEVKPGFYAVRVQKPVIQIQMHRFSYSPLDHKIHPMAFGESAIAFGLQFSFPQIYQTNEGRVEQLSSKNFTNKDLFSDFKRAIRTLSRPASFLLDGKAIKTSIRIDARTFPWINDCLEGVQVCY
ncbi:MAG: hypothetical protein WDZ28_03915 [Simkaniaceae bacterium]